MPKHQYFYLDEATDSFIDLLERGPARLVRLLAILAGLLIAVSFFL